jgi:hypothetical protein
VSTSLRLRMRVLFPIGIAAAMYLSAHGLTPASANPDGRTSGCDAVNAGALDINFKLAASGLISGLKGSGFVKGFEEGDELTFVQRAIAGSTPLVHRLYLAAFDRSGSNLIRTVLAFEEHVVPSGEEHVLPSGKQWSESDASFVVPTGGRAWAMFTATGAEGEGEYSVKVRCKPAPQSEVDGVS